jgi:hypothetical protein
VCCLVSYKRGWFVLQATALGRVSPPATSSRPRHRDATRPAPSHPPHPHDTPLSPPAPAWRGASPGLPQRTYSGAVEAGVLRSCMRTLAERRLRCRQTETGPAPGPETDQRRPAGLESWPGGGTEGRDCKSAGAGCACNPSCQNPLPAVAFPRPRGRCSSSL